MFREGPECVLVLIALIASMTGNRASQRRPVAEGGVAVAFAATLITWFIAVGIVHDFAHLPNSGNFDRGMAIGSYFMTRY